MKRNLAPEEHEVQREKDIINDRLNELFARIDEKSRLVSISNKGVWIDNERHVKVESTKGLPIDMLSYSSKLKYHFLNPFEALFCLETKQLMIHFNDLPLSLAEAYQLLIQNNVELRNYFVFQHFNRSGHYCLKNLCNANTDQAELAKPIEGGAGGSPCFESVDITFDAYKRETFARNKPHKGKRGNPDYHVVVCERAIHGPPRCKQLLDYGSRVRGNLSGKLLYALVNDSDNSICFNQFKPVDSLDLVLI